MAGNSFFQTCWLLLEDQLVPSTFSCWMIFSWSSCSHPFFQGLCRTDNFYQQLVIKNSYFFGRPILGIQFCKGFLKYGVCFCHRKSGSYLLREKCSNVEILSLRIQYECRKIRTRKNSLFGHFPRSDVLTEELAVIHYLSNFFRSSLFISKKKVDSTYVLFHRYYNHFYRRLTAIHFSNGKWKKRPVSMLFVSIYFFCSVRQQVWLCS